MGSRTNEEAGAGGSPVANVVRLAKERAAAADLRVGDPVMVRRVDEYGPAWVTEEGESIVEWLRVRPADGGPVVKVCRDQCRRPTKAEASGYGLERAPGPARSRKARGAA